MDNGAELGGKCDEGEYPQIFAFLIFLFVLRVMIIPFVEFLQGVYPIVTIVGVLQNLTHLIFFRTNIISILSLGLKNPS